MAARRTAKVLAWIGGILIGLPVLLLVLVSTPPVTRLVVRKLLPKVNQQLNGRLTVQDIGGSLLHRLELRGVTLRDPDGQIVLQAERVTVGYSVWDLLHSRISLDPLQLERPIVRLLKDHPGEQYSIVRVFQKKTETAQQPAGSVDLTIKTIGLHNGSVVATVWRQPAQPQREGAQQLDTVQLQNVNLNLPLIHYSASPTLARGAILEIASAQGFLTKPELELDDLRGEAQLHGDSLVIALRTIHLPNSRLTANAWLVTAPNRRSFDATADVRELRAGDVSGFVSGADIPADWGLRGTFRALSRASGQMVVSSPNIDITAAGGTIHGHITVVGADNEWDAQNSRLEVQGIAVERLLRAFNIPSSLRAQLDGVIAADHRQGVVDLQLAGAAGYGVRGPVNGHIHASGSMSALSLEAQLGGAPGDVNVSGRVAMGKHLKVDSLHGDLRHFDLAAVDARMPQSRINGRFDANVLFGSMPREASLRLFLDSSVVRGVPIDSTVIIAHADSGLLTADSIYARMPGVQLRGSGAFGLTEDQTGDLTLTLDAPSLLQVGPLVAALAHDTVDRLDGALRLDVVAKGSIKNYLLALNARGHDLALRNKGFRIDSLAATASGRPDSLAFNATAAVDSATTLSLGGRAGAGGRSVVLDSLAIQRGDAMWQMTGGRALVDHGKFMLDSIMVVRDPGPGQLTAAGAMPGAVTVRVERLPVADLLMKGRRDSLPDLDATVTYANGAAKGTVGLLLGDRHPLTADFITKPLGGHLKADSLDLALFAPLAPSLKGMQGRLNGDVAVEGAVDAPRLNGRLDLRDAAASVAATGVRYNKVNAGLAFSGATARLDSMVIAAGEGHAAITGQVQFARLDQPQLDVTVKTDHFPVMNRRDFLEAKATGELSLRGSPSGATLRGKAVLNEGNAYIQHFMHSAGIDLSDSLYAQFVDTSVLREANTGGRSIIESLMDSLKIQGITVDLGDHFWLKSPDASIQLSGQLTVRTAGGGGPSAAQQVESAEKYRLDGTVRTVRGIYKMTFAPGLSREFTIREGSIRYFGSPRKDAILDLSAQHVVRTAQGDEVTITAHIGGTLENPTIQLTSDQSPPLSETELISYLVFGAPTAQEFLGNDNENSQHSSVFEKSANQLVGLLSGKVESAVINQLGLPLDYFKIKPGEVQSGLAGTELVLGMQVRILGYPSFLRASPRFCPREQLLSLDHIGIDLETRFTKKWGVAMSVDPLQGCESVMSGTSARPYQLGVDLFWEKR
jgi:autotransporter translocation and assembly factor TamB